MSFNDDDINRALAASKQSIVFDKTYKSDLRTALELSKQTSNRVCFGNTFESDLHTALALSEQNMHLEKTYESELRITIATSKLFAPLDAITELPPLLDNTYKSDLRRAIAASKLFAPPDAKTKMRPLSTNLDTDFEAAIVASLMNQPSCRRKESFLPQLLRATPGNFTRLIHVIEIFFNIDDFETKNPLGDGICLARAIYGIYEREMTIDEKVDFLRLMLVPYFQRTSNVEVSIESESGVIFKLQNNRHLSTEIRKFITDTTLDNNLIHVASVALKCNICAFTPTEFVLYTVDPKQGYIVIVNPGGHWFRLLYQSNDLIPAWIVEQLCDNYYV
jgi:hypothetical protein